MSLFYFDFQIATVSLWAPEQSVEPTHVSISKYKQNKPQRPVNL